MMNYSHLLFYLFLASQSFLFAQTDSVKKKFKPYGLIDAAPVAINKDDFKPQIILTMQAMDALTNIPVNVRIDYYTFGDSTINTENGKVVSVPVNVNKKTVIVSNATGYIWQTQIVDSLDTDTSYPLKVKGIKKGDIITKFFTPPNPQMNRWETNLYADLIGISEFLKLNPSVKIQLSISPKGKKIIESYFSGKIDKKRFLLKCNPKQTNPDTFIVKIIHC